MKKRTITYLTDANLITCVIQKDLAEPVLEAAKKRWRPGCNHKLRSRNWNTRKNGLDGRHY
jgi:hypothetical protein